MHLIDHCSVLVFFCTLPILFTCTEGHVLWHSLCNNKFLVYAVHLKHWHDTAVDHCHGPLPYHLQDRPLEHIKFMDNNLNIKLICGSAVAEPPLLMHLCPRARAEKTAGRLLSLQYNCVMYLICRVWHGKHTIMHALVLVHQWSTNRFSVDPRLLASLDRVWTLKGHTWGLQSMPSPSLKQLSHASPYQRPNFENWNHHGSNLRRHGAEINSYYVMHQFTCKLAKYLHGSKEFASPSPWTSSVTFLWRAVNCGGPPLSAFHKPAYMQCTV